MSGTPDWAGAVAPGGPAGVPQRLVLRRVLTSPSGAMGVVIMALLVTVAGLAPLLAPVDPFAAHGAPLAAPSLAHPMGTDSLGRDVLSGVIFGTRTSLTLAAGVGLIAFLLGMAIGTLSGYRGGGWTTF